jgi:hypothetical protein
VTGGRALLALVAACAFLAIFATFDTSEQFRAWHAATRWTAEQRSVAPAMDAESMFTLIETALILVTSVIVFSFVSLMCLGVSVALESRKLADVARLLGIASLALGLAYVVLMVFYQARVGTRFVLKGPVYDYNLAMKPPVALAVGGFPLLLILTLVQRFRSR